MRTLLCYFLLLTAVVAASAQDDPEYRMEIGAGGGLVNYFGDFNGKATGELQPMGSLVAKFRPNPRMAWGVNISYGKLKGALGKADTWYPDADHLPQSFNNSLIDIGFITLADFFHIYKVKQIFIFEHFYSF